MLFKGENLIGIDIKSSIFPFITGGQLHSFQYIIGKIDFGNGVCHMGPFNILY